MKRTIWLFTLLLPLFTTLSAQNVSYDDVGVIVNTNSPASVAVGNYFMTERNIPVGNLIQITAPVQETIDSTQMNLILNQISAYLVFSQLEDSLNYLVTTTGVPLRVSIDGACDSSFTNPSGCTSFDSELALLLSSQENRIMSNMVANNYYVNSDTAFSRAQFDMYLVSRLDGYSEADAMALVDKGGPGIVMHIPSARIVLDYSDLNGGDISFFRNIQDDLEADMIALGYPVLKDTQNNVVVTGESQVAGFNAWYWQGAGPAPGHNWVCGAFAHLWEGDMQLTFDSTAAAGNINAGTLLREGATCAAAYSSASYSTLALQIKQFFPAYYDSTRNMNLAECYFRSILQLSQQNILLGDPKTSIAPDPLMSVEPPKELEALILYPNPARGSVTVRIQDNSGWVEEIGLIDLQGRKVRQFESGPFAGTDQMLDLQGLATGMYILYVQAEGKRYTGRLSLMP